MKYYAAERKKELLPITTRMDLESIMLSEISQAVKDKYHIISPISRTLSTKQTSKQNRTTDVKIKNKVTVTRGEVEGDNWGQKGEGLLGTCIKDPWTKPKGCRIKGRKWGWRYWGEW